MRRIGPDEGRLLKDLRLRALADAPYAYASSLPAEAVLSDHDWDTAARRRAEGHGSASFLAHAGGQPVGLVGCFVEGEPGHVELVPMWTAPAARRRGGARALIGAVVAWGRSVGAREVRLWVATDNAGAIRVYESAGFEGTGEEQPLPSHPDKNERRMRLVLAAHA